MYELRVVARSGVYRSDQLAVAFPDDMRGIAERLNQWCANARAGLAAPELQ